MHSDQVNAQAGQVLMDSYPRFAFHVLNFHFTWHVIRTHSTIHLPKRVKWVGG
ncbi:hypothetical protein HanHA300_Chr11g0408661 [Helianthus annuus]|nr:hypothetical protein HanHA300_Chr11g0408661 [Helianthus annuus]KAJ0510052.1 hypothetical protein HanIR_Chr11g0536281 [Helianthus annuus]KAJ0518008.1 hypothetical protein HanHA89_Chr11g0432361 [Helianthus annuus]KAJ0686028.1 hypothetical protein HanLR1_Chr11g0409901 [Helianthus annuus]KAJ0689880.1 hypothetical protein HanOQP8_Chr11g0411311 [Helianthus annuus]